MYVKSLLFYKTKVVENLLLRGTRVCLVCSATVTRTDNSTSENYVGLTENDFKTRCRNRTSSFGHAHSRNSTELSKQSFGP